MKQKVILWLTTILALGTVSAMVIHKETIIKDGTLMLLQLAPVDPRSIIQGDYMTLRYTLANQVRSAVKQNEKNGIAVVSLTPAGVAKFIRIHEESKPLEPNEHLLKFRKRSFQVRFAAEAWFFQEGHAADFSKTRYGELRVSDTGEAVLTGMRDKQFKSLRHVFKKPASASQ